MAKDKQEDERVPRSSISAREQSLRKKRAQKVKKVQMEQEQQQQRQRPQQPTQPQQKWETVRKPIENMTRQPHRQQHSSRRDSSSHQQPPAAAAATPPAAVSAEQREISWEPDRRPLKGASAKSRPGQSRSRRGTTVLGKDGAGPESHDERTHRLEVKIKKAGRRESTRARSSSRRRSSSRKASANRKASASSSGPRRKRRGRSEEQNAEAAAESSAAAADTEAELSDQGRRRPKHKEDCQILPAIEAEVGANVATATATQAVMAVGQLAAKMDAMQEAHEEQLRLVNEKVMEEEEITCEQIALKAIRKAQVDTELKASRIKGAAKLLKQHLDRAMAESLMETTQQEATSSTAAAPPPAKLKQQQQQQKQQQQQQQSAAKKKAQTATAKVTAMKAKATAPQRKAAEESYEYEYTSYDSSEEEPPPAPAAKKGKRPRSPSL